MGHRYSPFLIATLMPFALCAQAYGELNENDIRFRMFSNGFIGAKQGITPLGGFEVPQGTGANALYAGGLWFGGIDTTGSLHLAASLYNVLEQKDFFPGPLTNDGSASIDASVSYVYDHVWVVSRSEIAIHLAYHLCLNDPACDLTTVFPDGYTAPPSILGWPANNQNVGYEPLLAPFYDMNMDGLYDPDDGDVPCILGDQAMFAVFNDMLYPHTESGGLPAGLEVQIMPFVFSDQDPALDQTVFLRYHIINRSGNSYHNAQLGFFNDLAIGCPNDDFMGTDPSRNLLYAYNQTDEDVDCLLAVGYGTTPPAIGMTVIKGPLLDPNGIDDPASNAMPAWNGHGFGDGLVDNERHGLSRSMVLVAPNGYDPLNSAEFYNYMRGRWPGGASLTYGGNGQSTNPAAIPARFMLPGSDDPVGSGTDGLIQEPWSEPASMTTYPNRRGIFSMGPFTLGPGEHTDLVLAYIFARAPSGGALASVAALQARTDSVHAFAQTLPLFGFPEEAGFHGQCVDYPFLSVSEQSVHGRLVLFPSPASEQVSFIAPSGLVGGMLVLHDALGRVVLQQRVVSERNTLEIGGLADGVYICQGVMQDARFMARMVKQ